MKLWHLFLLILFIVGCATQEKADIETSLSEESKETIVKYRDKLEYIYKDNWLAAMFIVGGAASLFMLVRGMGTGFPLLIASAGGLIALRLDQTLAEKTWPYLLMGCLLLVGFVWYFYVTYIHKRAFKEVVAGGEKFKKDILSAYAEHTFENCQAAKKDGGVQSPSTQKLVKKVKRKGKK